MRDDLDTATRADEQALPWLTVDNSRLASIANLMVLLLLTRQTAEAEKNTTDDYRSALVDNKVSEAHFSFRSP